MGWGRDWWHLDLSHFVYRLIQGSIGHQLQNTALTLAPLSPSRLLAIGHNHQPLFYGVSVLQSILQAQLTLLYSLIFMPLFSNSTHFSYLCSCFHDLSITSIHLGLAFWYFNVSKVRATIPAFTISLFQDISMLNCCILFMIFKISNLYDLHLEVNL